ncbi:LexA family transcriptional regulator [Pantoea dispersa]|uniref:LexA family protein n=1 Tax=Pantoea dispersa TaxID=59814 RepID=UPI002DB68C10|nr:LexA family transcriptional regulator [Pantoea dispersa]MEB5973455.1 LexA family transcriptional regulator [Pantoea dispersa]
MSSLTGKQQQTLDFIKGYIRANGMAPTMQEIAEGMGWRSPNAAQVHVDALKRKGLVTIRRGVSRGLSVVGGVGIDIPAGWMLVPIEPTEEMMLNKSGCQHHAWDDDKCPMRESRRIIWKHMIEAAPEVGK